MRLLLILTLLFGTLFAKELSIMSDDGYKMYGWLQYPAEKKKSYPLALFAHQFGADHTTWEPLVQKVKELGYATLVVDLRGHGRSIMQDGKENKVIMTEDMDKLEEAFDTSAKNVGFDKVSSDLVKWMEHAQEQKDISINSSLMFGSSLGGGALIPLIAQFEPKAVVGISPGSGGVEEEELMMSLSFASSPALFIATKDDPLNAQDRAKKYADNTNRGMFLMVSGTSHGTVLLPFISPYIMTFLNENLN